jgi:hypothetical protein
MRPTGFASDDPEDITPSPDDDFVRWQWTLTCADESLVRATVEIEGHLAEAWSYRKYHYGDDLVAAARTKGRSLLERQVIGQDDPPLDWFVNRETYGPKQN